MGRRYSISLECVEGVSGIIKSLAFVRAVGLTLVSGARGFVGYVVYCFEDVVECRA